MLIAGIIALIVFALVRFFALRFDSGKFAVIYGVAGALIFLAGMGTYKLTHVPLAPAPVAAVAPAAVTAPATRPSNALRLTQAQVHQLTLSPGARPAGSLDVLTSAPTEAVNRTNNVFPAGATIYARGWAADVATKTPLPGIVLLLDKKEIIDGSAGYGLDRPDVAKAFGLATMELTGFSGVAIPTKGLAKGPHTLTLAGVSADGKHYLPTASVLKFTLT